MAPSAFIFARKPSSPNPTRTYTISSGGRLALGLRSVGAQAASATMSSTVVYRLRATAS